MAMLRSPLQRPQDEHVQRALQEFNAVQVWFFVAHKGSRPSTRRLDVGCLLPLAGNLASPALDFAVSQVWLVEVAHHDDVGLLVSAGKSQLFAVSGPGKGEHVATGELGQLYKSSAGQRLFPDIGGAVAGKQEGNGFAVGGEFGRLHAVRSVEPVQWGYTGGGHHDQFGFYTSTLQSLRSMKQELAIRRVVDRTCWYIHLYPRAGFDRNTPEPARSQVEDSFRVWRAGTDSKKSIGRKF